MVEHRSEKPGVDSSILSLGTITLNTKYGDEYLQISRACHLPLTPSLLRVRALLCIYVYIRHVKVVKVRRVGNSNVVSLPREFEAAGYGPGATVLVEQLEDGSLHLVRTDELRDLIRSRGKRLIAEHAEALAILAGHDRGAVLHSANVGRIS